MTRYKDLYQSIADLESNHKNPDYIESNLEFPFPKMYTGQHEILSKVQDGESFCLTSHTGFGKTPVFLSLTRNTPSIVIEPRKFLQTQVAGYYKDFVLFGRSGYRCQYAYSAAVSPCLLKEPCGGTNFHQTCKKATATCMATECKVFPVGSTYKTYPCENCEYMNAVREAQRALKSGDCVICNFGNFWNLLKHTETVVIDEADLFFREISAPMKLRYSVPKKHNYDNIKTLLDREVSGLQEAVKTAGTDAKFRYASTNALYSAQFLQANSDLCFKYQRKDWFYVEIDPRNVNILAKKLFKDKRVIIVSATPGSFDLPSYSASIHQRCGIYFAPVGNLTSRSLKANPYLMSTAAKAIAEISTYMELMYDAERVVVHCGNIGTHATALYNVLGERDCVLHQSGKLAETIDTYLKSGKKYLLVAAAEYGGDFGWCRLQFILKFPYPSLDERMRTLERTMGKEAFRAYYEGEARTRVIQMAGRNVRGFDDFGITVNLDSKIYDDYVAHEGMYPEWYRSRVDRRVY